MDSDENGIRDEIELLLKNRRDIDRRIEQTRLRLLRSLPQRYGFNDVDALIKALALVASEPMRGLIESSLNPASQRADRRGTRYPSDVRVAARRDLEAGIGAVEVSRRLKVPLPTITRWSKIWGVRAASRTRRARGQATARSSDQQTNGAVTLPGSAGDGRMVAALDDSHR